MVLGDCSRSTATEGHGKEQRLSIAKIHRQNSEHYDHYALRISDATNRIIRWSSVDREIRLEMNSGNSKTADSAPDLTSRASRETIAVRRARSSPGQWRDDTKSRAYQRSAEQERSTCPPDELDRPTCDRSGGGSHDDRYRFFTIV